jgi:hypothetical protein
MRVKVLVAFLFVAALGVNVSKAQVYRLPTPVPQATAASADWQIRGEPVFYAGDFYYPAGATVYFDGNVMVRAGTYQSVALYVDGTLEPYSIVYVPIGRNVMRPYERRRTGELAGTAGSRASSFVASSAITPSPSGVEPEVIAEAPRPVATSGGALTIPRAVGTGGTIVTPSTGAVGTATIGRPSTARPLGTVARPAGRSAVWLEYNGARWFSAGAAVTYSDDRFVPIGARYGLPVYRERNGSPNTIYVTTVQDGPVAPFTRP